MRRLAKNVTTMALAAWIAGALTASVCQAQSAPWDPVIRTILAGSLEDTLRGTAIDAAGNYYVTGGSASSDFPTTNGAYQTFLNPGSSGAAFGPHDVTVAKYSPQGQLLWSTFVGGPGYDRAYSIHVDDTGVYVGGRAGAGFPTTAGSLQPNFAGDSNPSNAYGTQDGFVFKLSLDGRSLLWATYFGGAANGFIRDITIDDLGQVYLVLTSANANNPHITSGAYQTQRPGSSPGVVAKLTSDGSGVVWASYLGGSASDLGTPSIRVNRFDEVFVAGTATSNDFPTTLGAFQRNLLGPMDMTLTAFEPDGSDIIFSTYVGGTNAEESETHCLEIAPDDSVYLASNTESDDFPTSANAFQQNEDALPGNGFIMRFLRDGTASHATIVGGDGLDVIEGVGIDSMGRVAVTGSTYSADFPLSATPYQSNLSGTADMFVLVLDSSLSTNLYSTYIGGTGLDGGSTVTMTSAGDLLVAGLVSGPFSTTDGTTYSGSGSNAREARDAAAVMLNVPEPAAGALQATVILTLAWARRRQRLRAMCGAATRG